MAEPRWAEFREWVKRNYPKTWRQIIGDAIVDSFKTGGLEKNAYWKAFIAVGGTPTQATLAREEKEADIELLESKGPYYQEDYPTADKLPRIDPAFEWVLVTSDPTTGRVLSQPEWVTRKKEEKQPTEVDLSGLPMVVPQSGEGFKEVWWDRATNTYYTQDALGKPVKITDDDAVRMRNLYLTSMEAQQTALTTTPEPSIAQQQWTASKNRREWAPGVNIEQDIDTGKLYRPGSMVEVSPDIANVELQSAQTAQTLKKDWTGEQLALEREKFAWTKEQATRQQDPELQRATNELRWERDRIQLLSGLPSDDWVSRYILENQPNPYRKQEGRVGEVSASEQSVEDVLDFQTANVQYQKQRLAEAITSGASTDTIAEFQGYVTESQKQRDTTYGAWKGMGAERRDWTPQPYPNAPEWLPPYAPGQVAGRMITPQNVPTPSGQQLTQMSRSRANQLGYFADWTARMGGGRNWRDILGEAEIMQPFTPRGAGGFRTSPARQWV